MSRKAICIPFLLLGLFISHRVFGQDLTEHDVRTMLDKLGQGSATSDFTLTDAQQQQLNSLSPDQRNALDIQESSRCVLNPRDPRIGSHQFVVCKGLFPPGMNGQQPAWYVKLGHPYPWHVVVINLPSDPGADPNEKLVQYTWEYDFSGLPDAVQQILKGAAPRPGMSVFRLQNGAWQWVAYR